MINKRADMIRDGLMGNEYSRYVSTGALALAAFALLAALVSVLILLSGEPSRQASGFGGTGMPVAKTMKYLG